MEERQSKGELLPSQGVAAGFEGLFRGVVERAFHVGFHAFGWFGGEFDAVLEYQHRERGCWHGGEPQTEVLVSVLPAGELFYKRLQPEHPAGCEVTVLRGGMTSG